ncbi:MAG: hypothetical protein GWP03_00210 [Proteobacteria bacterium]|nr:hypothetical protein [Pseudomonadota bacterium]
MKRILIVVVLLLPLMLLGNVKAGKTIAGASGVIGIKPSGMVAIGGLYGKMLTDNVEVGLSSSFMKMTGLPNLFSVGVYSYYHYTLTDAIVPFGGFDFEMPVKPTFTNTLNINVGFDYFLSESVALRVYNNFAVPKFTFSNYTDQIMIGAVAYF